MSKLFAVKLDTHSDVEILFSAPIDAGPAPYALEDIIEKGATTLSAALEMVRAVGQCAVQKLGDLDVESAEATVGLKLTAKGKFVVAEASADATLNVKFILKRRPQPVSTPVPQ
jgi:hypothetical protein